MDLPSMTATSTTKRDQVSTLRSKGSLPAFCSINQPSNLIELQPNLTDRSIGITQINHTLGVLQSIQLKMQESKDILLHLHPKLHQNEFIKSIILVEVLAALNIKSIQACITPQSEKQNCPKAQQGPQGPIIFNKPKQSLNKQNLQQQNQQQAEQSLKQQHPPKISGPRPGSSLDLALQQIWPRNKPGFDDAKEPHQPCPPPSCLRTPACDTYQRPR